MKSNKQNIEQRILKSCINIAKADAGALIVVGGKPQYKLLVKQESKYINYNIKRNVKKFEHSASLDGAMILTDEGIIKHYSAMIQSVKVLKGFGTRHSAALSASLTGAKVYLVSEEMKRVLVFIDGKMTIEYDAMNKNILRSIKDSAGLIEAPLVGLGVPIGTSLFLPAVGITPTPGIILFFGSFYYLTRNFEKIKRIFAQKYEQ